MKNFLPVLIAILAIILTGCSGKEKQTVVQFAGPYTEMKWALKELNPDMPSDWSSSVFLTFEMKSSTTQRFRLNLYDAEGVRSLEILPFQGVWIRASIPLIHFQKMNTEGMDQASIWKTPRPGYWIGFTGTVGPIDKIDSLGVAMKLPIGSPTLEIRNVRLTMSAEDTIFTTRPLVDDFGQWVPDSWPGKTFTIDDLKKEWSDEEKSLQSSDPDISKYGGFKPAKSKATGFFHVENVEGKWWFVDPDGYLFFSNGSCCIEPGTNLARIKGREYLFSAASLHQPGNTIR